ncbi:tail fiber domain-containing protein [Flagellimonas sp.]|uniref:tail fiber domain-containing protein n=1 Tax=Flagellimonas sp. TaxID=2058762 RepID=UPI003F4A2A50
MRKKTTKKMYLTWGLTLLCILCAHMSFGQWQQFGNQTFNDGYVHIGDDYFASPTKLEVRSDASPLVARLVDGSPNASLVGFKSHVISDGQSQRVGVWADMNCQVEGNRIIGLYSTASFGTTADGGVYGVYTANEEYNYFSGNVGIGVTYPSTSLDVAGTVKIQGGNPGEGKVLTSDANGLASWQEPQGGGGEVDSHWIKNGDDLRYTDGNVSIGTFNTDYRLEARTSNRLGFRQAMITNSTDQSIGIHNQVTHEADNGVVFGEIATITSSTSKFVVGSQIQVAGEGFGDRIGQQISMTSDLDGGGEIKALDISVVGSAGKPTYGVYVDGEDQNYFDGWVGVGTKHPDTELDVKGTIHYTGSIFDVSDARFKKDIQKLESSLDKIKEIDGVSYYMRKNEFPDMKFGDTMEYGFTAQDVEEVFPNLVSTNKEGYKSLNYTGIIPVLVEALKEQQAMIENLQEEIRDLKNGDTASSQSSGSSSTDDMNTSMPAELFQNVPNPFSGETEIAFFIPREVGTAELILYNMQGTQIRNIPISERGEGSVRLSGFGLQPGIYLYALVADGTWIDTKKMLLR